MNANLAPSEQMTLSSNPIASSFTTVNHHTDVFLTSVVKRTSNRLMEELEICSDTFISSKFGSQITDAFAVGKTSIS
jgi:hypothetical protein